MIEELHESTLVNRLRGIYEIGPKGEFGTRDFSALGDFIAPISLEAASRIEELEKQLSEVRTDVINECIETVLIDETGTVSVVRAIRDLM